MEIVIMLFAIIMFVIMVGGAIFTLIYALVKESEKEDIVEIDGHKCRIKAVSNFTCEGCMFANESALYCTRVVRCLSKYGKNIIFVEVKE